MVAQIDRRYIRTRPWKLWSRILSYALFEGRPLTTQGRWINPLIFAHFGLEKRLPRLKQVNAPVFILGTGRSGTTILGIVLSMHRDVGFLNEPKAMWHSIHGTEDLIGSYTRVPTRYRLDQTDAVEALRQTAHRLYGAYLLVTFSRRIVDKYPEMIFRVPFLKAIFPDAKFIFLSRGVWDTCSSIGNWSSRLGQEIKGEQVDWWGANRRKWRLLVEQIIPEHADLADYSDQIRMLTDQRVMAVVEWIVTMREGMNVLRNYPEDVLHVPYDRLCANPGAMASQIASFAGLRDDESYLKYAKGVLAPPTSQPSFRLPDYLEAPLASTQAALQGRRHV